MVTRMLSTRGSGARPNIFHSPSLHMQTSVVIKGKLLTQRAFSRAFPHPWRVLSKRTTFKYSASGVQHAQASPSKLFGEKSVTEKKTDDQEILQKAIMYEAQHGFPNCAGRTKRFNEFLVSKLATMLNANSSLFGMAQSYEKMDVHNRIVMLDKVCAHIGFKSVQDLLDQHDATNEASSDLHTSLLELNNKKNVSQLLMLQKKSHPAILFGSSERIELFNLSNKTNDSVNKLPSEVCDVACKDEAGGPFQTYAAETSTKRKGGLLMANERTALSHARKAKKAVKKFQASCVYEDWMLNMPISSIEGLASKTCSQLEESGFYTVRRLLQHYPRNYVNFLQAGKTIEDGQYLTFSGKIISSKGFKSQYLGIIEILIASLGQQTSDSEDGNHIILHVKKFFRGLRYASTWFLQKMSEKFPAGAYVAVSGKVKSLPSKNHYEIKEYNLEIVPSREHDGNSETLYPVYPSKGRLDGKFFRTCIQKVLSNLPLNIDSLPEPFRVSHKLMDLREAYFGIHMPDTEEVVEKARQRFVFDEFFFLQLGLLLWRQELRSGSQKVFEDVEEPKAKSELACLPIEKWAPLTSKMLACLPYELTNSQVKVLSEIIWDLQKPFPMQRLLQGDVGCGKTVVAFLALLEVIDAGLQGVLMGPTDFLAKQHYECFTALLEHLEERSRPKIALLTNSVPPLKARAIRKGLETGEVQLVVGTHSLISESVRFASLGLVVIDEQHRFGVEQRLMLLNKGSLTPVEQDQNKEQSVSKMRAPHFLAMTATPIPRTLAFALYGHMDLSQIDELPSGRKPVRTSAMLSNEEGLRTTFKMVHEQLANNGRVFIVCAIIDESEVVPNIQAATTEYKKIEQEFAGYSCGLVHGKLRQQQRDATMNAFKSGQIQVLVATTIVEVGIDIVEASMMVVMNAERFGMAQLHQLRGRVGRGVKQSVCVLLTSSKSTLERIKCLETSNDGFHLAEVDLRLRGPGDMLGRKQAGYLPEFSLACLSKDSDLMIRARKAAQMLDPATCPGLLLEGIPCRLLCDEEEDMQLSSLEYC